MKQENEERNMMLLARQAIAKFHHSATCSFRHGRPRADHEQVRKVTELLSTQAGIDVCDCVGKVFLFILFFFTQTHKTQKKRK
jgi:hypothetical protein